ncbi:MAG: radical SAM protein [Faecalibacterium sp.]
MNTTFEELSHKMQRTAAEKLVELALSHVNRDREKAYLQMVDLAEQFYGSSFTPEDYDNVRAAIRDPDNKWIRYIDRVLDETAPHVAKMTALNLGFEAFFRGTKMIRKNREVYQCNIPWLILFDPTSACNMHCAGCWAGEYGNRNNLSFEDMDRIVTQGKELGVYLYMLTGGEPLVRKADVLRLAEKHNDVQFAIYTNSTLIDEALCQEAVRLGNLAFMLSIEGTPETNDARRGEGHYAAVMRAMDLLKAHGLIFGTSICYTRANIDAVTSDDFLKMISEKGARFGFYFHYMPVGNAAVPDLLPTPEQRRYMIDRIRYVRSQECPIEFFPMDFQNDGQYVGGCIAGGRNYFHINSAGDAEPCVFIHYSNANIHEKSILEILHSPLFMAYRDGQPFNKNHLRPCPMLENPDLLQKMVHDTGAHSTDLESPETVEHLCAKCSQYAADWQPAADEIWSHTTIGASGYENYKDWKPEERG